MRKQEKSLKERSYAYDVYLKGKLIDTVFAAYRDEEEMYDSLVNHDGYDPAIEVTLVESAKKGKKMRKKETDNTIEITEEVRVPGTDVILEAGDRIEVMKEASGRMLDRAENMVDEIFGGDYEKAFNEVLMGMSDDEVKDAVDYIYRMWT